jgi:glycosyltransferase involved in cell wall biosynthesis
MPVSIVMPCYNEGEIIETVVNAYHKEIIAKIPGSEFIIIDDCSTDGTYTILKKLQSQLMALRIFRMPINSGHGKTIRNGYELAKREWIFQVDSDNQFQSSDFWKLYSLKDKYDFILGFRKQRVDHPLRQMLSYIMCIVNLIFFGAWIKDANCPFRIMKRAMLDKLTDFVDSQAIAPNIIISILAKKKGFKTIEIPVLHYNRKTGRSSLKNYKLIKLCLIGFWQLILLRIRLLKI